MNTSCIRGRSNRRESYGRRIRDLLLPRSGARALRAIIEEFMLDIMYEIPKDDNIGRVVITRDYIENHGAPRIIMRGVPQIESAQ